MLCSFKDLIYFVMCNKVYVHSPCTLHHGKPQLETYMLHDHGMAVQILLLFFHAVYNNYLLSARLQNLQTF